MHSLVSFNVCSFPLLPHICIQCCLLKNLEAYKKVAFGWLHPTKQQLLAVFLLFASIHLYMFTVFHPFASTLNLLKDSVVHQELCGQRGQQGDAHSQAEAAAGAVEAPPQADGERRQSQRQLHVVGKVHFLTEAEGQGTGSQQPRELQAVSYTCLSVIHHMVGTLVNTAMSKSKSSTYACVCLNLLL